MASSSSLPASSLIENAGLVLRKYLKTAADGGDHSDILGFFFASSTSEMKLDCDTSEKLTSRESLFMIHES
jgi:hypothetical protein